MTYHCDSDRAFRSTGASSGHPRVWGPKVALELPGRGPAARLAWHAATVAPIEAGRSDATGRGGQLSVGACMLYTCSGTASGRQPGWAPPNSRPGGSHVDQAIPSRRVSLYRLFTNPFAQFDPSTPSHCRRLDGFFATRHIHSERQMTSRRLAMPGVVLDIELVRSRLT